MTPRKPASKGAGELLRAMHEMLLEAPEGELSQLLKDTGLDIKTLSSTSRSLAERAIQQNKASAAKAENIIVMHRGLNSLLQMLRRRDGLDETQLAKRAEIDETEIRQIENEPGYEANPRTIYKLEREFNLPSGVLAKLSGAIKHQSPLLEEQVLKFAANAKTFGRLNRGERQLLAEFVKFLAEKP